MTNLIEIGLVMGHRVRREDRTVSAGERNRAKLLKYLSEPANDWPKRQDYSIQILDYKRNNAMYQHLSPQEISAIEAEALEIIKAQSCLQRKVLYAVLYQERKKGNVQAIKEFLDRTEGKISDKHQHSFVFEDILDEVIG